MMAKPFSQSCENNKLPILNVLSRILSDISSVVEIGSGTGQHAAFFAKNLSHVTWQPTDRAENIEGIQSWVSDANLKNLLAPVEYDIRDTAWPYPAEAVFSANTAHIMPLELTLLMFKKTAENLPVNGIFALYGPFNYGGDFTSESNRHFDGWLKSVAEHQGIRHFEELNAQANKHGLVLAEDNEMPANNRLIVWKK